MSPYDLEQLSQDHPERAARIDQRWVEDNALDIVDAIDTGDPGDMESLKRSLRNHRESAWEALIQDGLVPAFDDERFDSIR